MSSKNKYLKYKFKYLNKQYGGVGAVAHNRTINNNGSSSSSKSSGPKSSGRGIFNRTDDEKYIFEIKNMLTCFCMREETYIKVLQIIYPIVPKLDICTNYIYKKEIKELNKTEINIYSDNFIIKNKVQIKEKIIKHKQNNQEFKEIYDKIVDVDNKIDKLINNLSIIIDENRNIKVEEIVEILIIIILNNEIYSKYKKNPNNEITYKCLKITNLNSLGDSLKKYLKDLYDILNFLNKYLKALKNSNNIIIFIQSLYCSLDNVNIKLDNSFINRIDFLEIIKSYDYLYYLKEIKPILINLNDFLKESKEITESKTNETTELIRSIKEKYFNNLDDIIENLDNITNLLYYNLEFLKNNDKLDSSNSISIKFTENKKYHRETILYNYIIQLDEVNYVINTEMNNYYLLNDEKFIKNMISDIFSTEIFNTSIYNVYTLHEDKIKKYFPSFYKEYINKEFGDMYPSLITLPEEYDYINSLQKYFYDINYILYTSFDNDNIIAIKPFINSDSERGFNKTIDKIKQINTYKSKCQLSMSFISDCITEKINYTKYSSDEISKFPKSWRDLMGDILHLNTNDQTSIYKYIVNLQTLKKISSNKKYFITTDNILNETNLIEIYNNLYQFLPPNFQDLYTKCMMYGCDKQLIDKRI